MINLLLLYQTNDEHIHFIVRSHEYVDFFLKAALSHVTSAKTQETSAAVFCLTELSFEKIRRYYW